ncbi:MAG: methyl-accepting chemotaxis protein [Ignavibacteriales bacterium]
MFQTIKQRLSRMWIKQKIMLLISIFGLVMIAFYSYFSYENERALISKSIDDNLIAGAYSVYYAFGDAYHDRIVNASSVSETENLENTKKLSLITKRLGLAYVYSMVETPDDTIHITSSSASDEELAKGTYSPFFQAYSEASEEMHQIFRDKKQRFEEYTDRWGTLRSVLIPFTSASGKTYVIGADYSLKDIYNARMKTLWTNISAGFGLYILFLLITSIVVKRITKPIYQLAEAAKKISDGDLNVSLAVESRDETRLLSDAMEKMVANVNQSLENLMSEKASVEKKVEEAIKESEAGKEYLSRSTEKLLVAMDRFSSGDLTVRLSVEKDDTIGKLFKGFNSTAESFNSMVTSVANAVEETASASSQISASTEEMAQGSSSQAHQAAEIATAVEQMTRTIIDNTRNTALAADTAKEAGEKAKDGGSVVKDTISGMNKIAEVVLQSASTVKELGKNSGQIGEIVQVIDDIADQTNLLALNAAIEAARAGEQGRGFAVVADEVRKLAEKTTKATKEIAMMIRQIQKDTDTAIESISKGTEEVESGKAMANRAGMALDEIIQGTGKVSDLIRQIAAASEEQSSASEEISKNVEAITEVTRQSSAGIHQVAQAAEGLGRLTLNLQSLVRKFNTGEHKVKLTPPVQSRQFALNQATGK